MALLVSILVLVLAAAVPAVGQREGFLSIDCGLENSSGYQENYYINYVPDGPYVDGGKSYSIVTNNTKPFNTLRSFPSGEQNCYSLPTHSGGKYLVRLGFYYGNYDGKNSSTSALKFDLYLGVNRWTTMENTIGVVYEAIFVAWASWAPVCLVNTGHGTPFVNLVELRRLDDMMYPAVMANQSLGLVQRSNMGGSSFLRYPNDRYDRYWWPMEGISASSTTWINLTTSSTITEESMFEVPSAVLQTAVTTTSGNNTVLPVITWQGTTDSEYAVFLHFADFQRDKRRYFDAYINYPESVSKEFYPPYLQARSVYSDWFIRDPDGKYNITLTATNDSVLPPMINAFEIYSLITRNTTTTFSEDFDAIMAIKFEYAVKKNWMGDPCFPINLSWDGVKCNTTGNITRIISLDLSNSNLHGEISNNFTLLTALENLNLSGNQLNGPIPDSLCKNNGGQFVFSYGSDGNICNKTIGSSRSRKTAVLVISVVVPVLVAAVLVVAYLIWRTKRKPNKPVSAYDPLSVPDPKNSTGNRTNQLDHLQKTENRRFTYEELKKFTDNFQQFIGQGGFGKVYFGCLENSSEVAVKMLSELSSQGLDEFLAEVQSLTKVHHKNLVSLVGYCWEKNHLALVYEYMSRGSLYNHLRGKIDVDDTFNWATRVRVVLEAAQGLDYLHKGCNLPIIHGDVKTNNVLLGHNLKAKIADFGLSKTYNSETQTHISTPAAAGTMGYMDPEYYHTGRLTESSDVYSFGIVLLEVATGEPPILPGHGHIIQRVKQNITSGNIHLIADARLKGSYDVSSMWKVLDIAMMCTADVAAQRPTMSTVVVQLKDSLALEEAREDTGFTVSSVSDAISEVSTFGPSAR